MSKNKKSILRIIIKGYEVAATEGAMKTIWQQFSGLKKKIRKLYALPTKRSFFSLLASPHKHKRSQEQFDRQIHCRVIEIEDPSPSDLARLDPNSIPNTVYLKIKEISAA
jgi:small subunit ribosomal protein S10